MRNTDLKSLVKQLQLDEVRKKDYVVPNNLLTMQNGAINLNFMQDDTMFKEVMKSFKIDVKDKVAFNQLTLNPTDIAIGHIREKFRIPSEYFKRLQENHQDLLDYTVSYFFEHSPKSSFVRTFENGNGTGILRAVLSDRFRVIDHLDVLITALEAIKEMNVNLEIETCDLTDRKMYVRFYCPDIEVEAKDLLNKWSPPHGNKPKRIPKRGDGIISGFVLTNSEVGEGQYTISPRAIILACDNGMINSDDAIKHVHLGGKMETGIIWSENTKQKNMELIISETQDAVKTFLSKDYLAKWIDEIQENNFELRHPVEAVNNVCKFAGLNDEKTKSVVDYFVKSGSPTTFGLSQALTWFAQETDADQQYELEIVANNIGDRVTEFDKASLN